VRSGVQTESLPPSASNEILNKQRLARPSSPHFTIYQPQLTWLGSIANRVTGSGLSVRACPRVVSFLGGC
jgi:succinate dehydrogenase (ubiquinone) cytochrome b560 subunit